MYMYSEIICTALHCTVYVSVYYFPSQCVLMSQSDQFVETVSEMSNLRWLRLNRSQLCSLPDEIDRFQKLVS